MSVWRCSECQGPFQKNLFRTNRMRETCSPKCQRARKTRLQAERRAAAAASAGDDWLGRQLARVERLVVD